MADGLAGLARLAGGAFADDPQRRRATAVGGYTSIAVLTAMIGAATAPWQVAALRVAGMGSRAACGGPARSALLADVAPPEADGRAYGFERMMDNLGAIGPCSLSVSSPSWAFGLRSCSPSFFHGVTAFEIPPAKLLSTRQLPDIECHWPTGLRAQR